MKDGRLVGIRQEGNVWKGLVAGVAGGLAATLVMNRFQALWSRQAWGRERSHGAQSMQQGFPQHGVGRELRKRGSDEDRDDAAMRLANAISVGLFDHELAGGEKEVAGTAIHYAFGVTTGGLYGAAAELLPQLTTGAGLPFGVFVWLSADEGIVPVLGLSRMPTEYPLSIHAYALTSHLIYGLTAELVRRALRQRLG